MPLKKYCSVQSFRDNISFLVREGYEQDQAVAIAFETLRKACGAPPRAKDEQWSPEEIVAYKKRQESIGEGSKVVESVIADMSESEFQMLLDGLKEIKEKNLLSDVYKKYGVLQEVEDEDEETEEPEGRKGKDATAVLPSGIEDSDTVEDVATLSEFDIESDLTEKMSASVVEALAEYFREQDFKKVTTTDIRNILKAVSNVLYKLSRRFPMLARREIRMLKTRGPEGFIRWFRQQMLR